MRKLFLVMALFLSFGLAACGGGNNDNGNHSNLTEAVVQSAIETWMDASSFEVRLRLHVKTDEFEMIANPLLTIQSFQDDDDMLMHVEWRNKIFEGAGIGGMEMYMDAHAGEMYIWNVDYQQWEKDSMGMESGVNPMLAMIDEVLVILKQGLIDFVSFEAKGTFQDGDRTLARVTLTYDMYQIAENIFNYFNDEMELGYEDLMALLEEMELEQLAALFEEVEIDIFLDNQNRLAGVEIDLKPLIANLLDVVFSISEEGMPDNFDFDTVLEYIHILRVGMMFSKVGTLPKIVIPEDALNALPGNVLAALADANEVFDAAIDYALDNPGTGQVTAQDLSWYGYINYNPFWNAVTFFYTDGVITSVVSEGDLRVNGILLDFAPIDQRFVLGE